MSTESALMEVDSETLPATSDLMGDSPAARIGLAREVAGILAPVIRDQGLSSKIQGREYVLAEGWTLLGRLLGVVPVCAWVKPLEHNGEVFGFEARVEARSTPGGELVGAAQAICSRSERNWANRDGFALYSMAQTRATSKALRMPLGFVMQLAGYEATPAEEMDAVRDVTPPRPAVETRAEDLFGSQTAQTEHPSEADMRHTRPMSHAEPESAMPPVPEAAEPWLLKPIGFGKFKERTWQELAEESSWDGEGHRWLKWATEHLEDAGRLKAVRYCLKRVEERYSN